MTARNDPTDPAAAGRPRLTVADAMEPGGPRITPGAGVGQAERLLDDSGATCLLVCTDDDRCQGMVTPASLAPFLACTWYSDHSQVQDAISQGDPFAWPTLALSLAAVTMGTHHLDLWPVVDDDGHLLGIITRTRVTALLANPRPLALATAPCTDRRRRLRAGEDLGRRDGARRRLLARGEPGDRHRGSTTATVATAVPDRRTRHHQPADRPDRSTGEAHPDVPRRKPERQAHYPRPAAEDGQRPVVQQAGPPSADRRRIRRPDPASGECRCRPRPRNPVDWSSER
ncbi:CBS domain-containing protein [Kitasatospora sp. DSM 101779]|uniref:CBS domain-containing protein n=1 Tax=Kitasatospora sp. DSM 101779 TaxID=2853165 RepID=UPI0021D9E9D3|nr:CBS domain-containing protein [Kitasatospora sp. DSM 101779]MCU7827338.1 CBS domain-containing protein [Kitasatospora sp. DSM 101779]MCU7827399.1 CBS domain-containing protein [Kitasatospora sp. DSM 101779]